MTATDKPKAPGLLDGKFSPTRPLAASGNLFAFALDVTRALPKRPFHHGTEPAKVQKILDRVTRTSTPGPRGFLKR